MSGNIVLNEGFALQVISIENGKFHLNETSLSSILNHPKSKNKPVCLIYNLNLPQIEK